MGLVDALSELEVVFHASPHLFVVCHACFRPGRQFPPAEAFQHASSTVPFGQGGGHAGWPGKSHTALLCAVFQTPSRANTTGAVCQRALSELLSELVRECHILAFGAWQWGRLSSPQRVVLVWRPQTWSANHSARSAVSPNVDSTAVTRRIPVSIVDHWVAASPVWLGTPRLPPPESFPGGVVAP